MFLNLKIFLYNSKKACQAVWKDMYRKYLFSISFIATMRQSLFALWVAQLSKCSDPKAIYNRPSKSCG